MGFGLGFMVLLMIVGGFAAYQGDKVGRFAGRRRLSILGLRPRYTSRIITIITGVIIVLFTLVSLILLSENVRQALFGMEQLRASVEALSTDLTAKNTELEVLEQQRTELFLANDRLSNENAQLQARNDELKQQSEALTEQTRLLTAERDRLESERVLLVEQLASLRKAGEYYFDQASRLQEANFSLRQASFVYHALDILGSVTVDARESPTVLREQLEALVAAANEKVLGSGLRDDGVGVRIDRVIVQEGGVHTLVSADTVIDLAVKAIKEDPNTESVIVQLISLTNAAPGEIVQADFNLIRNVVVFSQGEVIARRTFDGSRSPSEIFEEFILWIQGEARDVARNRGMMPQDDGTFGGVSPRQAYEVVEFIARHGSEIELVAFAAEECWTRGPLVLGFAARPLELQYGEGEAVELISAT
ncbi:MAG: DUF3084 domain-containing protein [Limnochordia bacterium]|jgi:uncharacterized protein (DUF3084 family)